MPRPRRRPPTTVREEVPHDMALMVARRTDGLIRACSHEENFLRSLVLSVYVQGMMDALQVADQVPGFLDTFLGKAPTPPPEVFD